jgi:uncharacterized phosphosugar-binding protein
MIDLKQTDNIIILISVFQRNNHNIPIHDFVKNKYSTTVKLTSFSIQKHLKKRRRRGWSFPCRVILERQKVI